MAKTPKRKATDQLQVWIELERPAGNTPAEREADATHIARHANRMLQRLSPGTSYHFFWSEHRACWNYGDRMGYTGLTDNGWWLNLEHLGREFDQHELDRGLREPNLKD